MSIHSLQIPNLVFTSFTSTATRKRSTMSIAKVVLVAGLGFLRYTFASTGDQHHTRTLNNLTSPYTVTAYVPWNCEYNGLKIENWNVFQPTVASYCPFLGTSLASSCPNGTDMVLVGSLYQVCVVQCCCSSQLIALVRPRSRWTGHLRQCRRTSRDHCPT